MKKFYAVKFDAGDCDYCLFIVKILKKNCRRFRVVKIVSSNYTDDILPSTTFKKGMIKTYKYFEDCIIASSDSFKECCDLAMLEIL